MLHELFDGDTHDHHDLHIDIVNPPPRFFYFSMHNIIQELRGNVRVFARIRPFLPDDGKQGDEGGDTPLVSHEGDAIVSVVSYFIR